MVAFFTTKIAEALHKQDFCHYAKGKTPVLNTYSPFADPTHGATTTV